MLTIKISRPLKRAERSRKAERASGPLQIQQRNTPDFKRVQLSNPRDCQETAFMKRKQLSCPVRMSSSPQQGSCVQALDWLPCPAFCQCESWEGDGSHQPQGTPGFSSQLPASAITDIWGLNQQRETLSFSVSISGPL